MARGGKREGAGRKRGVKLPDAADRGAAARLLEALNKKAPEKGKEDYEVAQWRLLTEAGGDAPTAPQLGIRLRAREYLYDKRDGKAVQPMDFSQLPISVVIDLPSAVTRRAVHSKG